MADGGSIFGALADALDAQSRYDWPAIARPSQLAPPGAWTVWLQLAGRGFGKTRSGAEWVRQRVEAGIAKRIALVAPTEADARSVMVEGESGIMAISPPWLRPIYEPSKHQLTWPNGAIGTLFSSAEPERLRGPQTDTAWCDELAAWQFADVSWSNLMLGLRLGRDPRCVVTTTPRPVRVIRDLLADDRTDVVVTRGRTRENEANLAPAFLDQIIRQYEGTRLGRQELDAELLEDTPGALWRRATIDDHRVAEAPDLTRIVVAIDPAATSGEDADETGILTAGVGRDRHVYVLADGSGRYQPMEWAKRAIGSYRLHDADRIIAEINNGGEMVEATLRQVDPSVSFKSVHASRGKVVRAEPVAALYETGRVHHVGTFAALEDQMCAFTTDGERRRGSSPDRVDALVWALSELVVSRPAGGLAGINRALGKLAGAAPSRDPFGVGGGSLVARMNNPLFSGGGGLVGRMNNPLYSGGKRGW